MGKWTTEERKKERKSTNIKSFKLSDEFEQLKERVKELEEEEEMKLKVQLSSKTTGSKGYRLTFCVKKE